MFLAVAPGTDLVGDSQHGQPLDFEADPFLDGNRGHLDLGALVSLTSCGGGTSASSNSSAAGTILEHPAGSPTRSRRFVVDPNHGGRSAELHMTRLAWGRLVDVYDLDEQGRRRLQHEDYVIGADVTTNPIDLVLEISPVTLEESVIIRHTAGVPDSRYDAIFSQLDRNLRPVDDVGFENAGTFTMVPRNAVLVATFDDLIEPESVSADGLRLWVGNPPTLPFIARVVPDYNHGDLTQVGGQTVFRSTRVILDPTVTQLESFQSDPPLPVNGVGFPPSTTVNLANLSLRLPTREQNSIGIERVLRNLSGHSLSLTQNGTIDFGSPSVDVLRFMRTGGRTQVTEILTTDSCRIDRPRPWSVVERCRSSIRPRRTPTASMKRIASCRVSSSCPRAVHAARGPGTCCSSRASWPRSSTRG